MCMTSRACEVSNSGVGHDILKANRGQRRSGLNFLSLSDGLHVFGRGAGDGLGLYQVYSGATVLSVKRRRLYCDPPKRGRLNGSARAAQGWDATKTPVRL